jgi:uncharacterized protein YbbC (DUF1343 family)
MKVKFGIDGFSKGAFLDAGKSALFTNASGVSSRWNCTVDIVQPDYIFTGEHGYFEEFLPGEQYTNYKDPISGRRIYSVYGRGMEQIIPQIDTLFVDIQDVGVRCFTYAYTLYKLIKLAKERMFSVVVFDRPNPLGKKSFGKMFSEENVDVRAPFIPFIYPFTLGELALFYVGKIGAKVTVARMENYKKEMNYEQTRLPFSSPSPNLSDIQSVYLYPALVLLEGLKVSVGRFTQKPFRQVGTPRTDMKALLKFLESKKLKGVLFKGAVFTPSGGIFTNEKCFGAEFYVTDQKKFDEMLLGFYLFEYFAENAQFIIVDKIKFINVLCGENFTAELKKYGVSKLHALCKKEGDAFLNDVNSFFIY